MLGSCSDHSRIGRALEMTFHLFSPNFSQILEGHFSWQAQYLVRLEDVASRSAHCKSSRLQVASYSGLPSFCGKSLKNLKCFGNFPGCLKTWVTMYNLASFHPSTSLFAFLGKWL